ncbi:hypothetical protein N7517_010361 [Penicillium concentricum]|uniref:Uncharacterized protein n=1 Tax=Penicillium concentricum TaxID=293559 RepID=A0A9W9USJ0_9EURO|nr:uncharacterized protein N7517_010361 [Penicillium concentricum]KAJ5355752.1 hypothetical protein N7517_010361 [Penicillium concentricum]
MSPAMIAEMQPDLHHDQLEAVGKAFDALLLTVYQLTHRQNELLQHMDNVFKEYTDVIEILPPQDRHHAQDVQSKLFAQQEEYRQGLVHSKPRVAEQPLNSMDVIKTLVAHQNVDENTFSAIKNGVKGCKALLRSQDSLSQISSNSCILAQAPAPAIALEKDFTTNGTQGYLQCPFSKPNKMKSTNGSEALSGQDSAPKIQIEATCGHEHLDPIKAEQDERRSSHTPSAPSSKGGCPVSRCPIRFLDQHSPEEIAEYVERHKHEIPRSHAICVKRYQRNPQDMRHLDAKYGGLTSMIAGLGVKHQAFLPDRQTNGEGHSSHSASTERVEKWADNVDPNTPIAEIEEKNEEDKNEDDNRQSHFDRPLREVRVGESPSRPWGISVPVTHLPPASTPFSGSASITTSLDPQADKPDKPTNAKVLDAKPAGGCPFGHGKPKPETQTSGSGERPEDKNVAPPEKSGCPFGHKPKAEVAKPETEAPWSGDWPKTWPKEQAVTDQVTDQVTNQPPAPEAARAPTAPVSEDSTTKPDIPSTFEIPSHITFNGPVFFGYSAEETVNLLQQLGNLGKS